MLGLLVVVGVVPRWIPPRPGITEENCARIRPGMGLEEVDAILGGPPGFYRSGRRVGPGLLAATDAPTRWVGERGTVRVWFDKDVKATRAEFAPEPSTRQ